MLNLKDKKKVMEAVEMIKLQKAYVDELLDQAIDKMEHLETAEDADEVLTIASELRNMASVFKKGSSMSC